MSSSVHINKKKKDILILGFDPTQGFDDTTLTAKAQYSINFSRSNRKFYLSLRYNESSRFLFFNTTKTYQFKGKKISNAKISLVLRKYFRRLLS